MFRPKMAFESFLLSAEKTKVLTKLYGILSMDVNYGELAKSQWENDLAISWSEEAWSNLKKSNFLCSLNVAIQENRFKMIYRWHLTPRR